MFRIGYKFCPACARHDSYGNRNRAVVAAIENNFFQGSPCRWRWPDFRGTLGLNVLRWKRKKKQKVRDPHNGDPNCKGGGCKKKRVFSRYQGTPKRIDFHVVQNSCLGCPDSCPCFRNKPRCKRFASHCSFRSVAFQNSSVRGIGCGYDLVN